MAEGINQVLTIPSYVVAIAQSAQSLPPHFVQPGATEMATIKGTNFNDNDIDKPKLVGTNADDSIYGYAGNDILSGLGGNDYLDGGPGSDDMFGGADNDTYIVDSQNDKVTENFNQGIDTVISSVTFPLGYRLGENQENLKLIGNAYEGYGNALNNTITGNAVGNYIDGEAGNDYIDGAGGNDNLYGEAGNDTLIGDLGNDYLFGGANNDSLVGGWDDDNLYGGTGNDILLGGSGKDYLDGFGNSTEFDILTGGTLGDTFVLGYSTIGYYLGNGHATITDFKSLQADKIQVAGSTQDYSLVKSGSNTNILYKNDLIAVVQNVELNQTNLVSAPIVNPPL
ncbi:calcium-binding protein [Microcoleus sp. Pol7_A1]